MFPNMLIVLLWEDMLRSGLSFGAGSKGSDADAGWTGLCRSPPQGHLSHNPGPESVGELIRRADGAARSAAPPEDRERSRRLCAHTGRNAEGSPAVTIASPRPGYFDAAVFGCIGCGSAVRATGGWTAVCTLPG